MLIANREMGMAVAYCLVLAAWGIWVAVDNDDINVYGPLRYNILHDEHGTLHHIQLKYLVWLPAALMALTHMFAALAWTKDSSHQFQPIGDTRGGTTHRTQSEGVVYRPLSAQVRAIAHAMTTIFSLIAMGVGNIWFFGAIAVILYMVQNVEVNLERNENYDWRNTVMDLYNIFTHHVGIWFIFAFMLVVLVQIVDDKPCYWHPVSWGIFFVWSFFNIVRLVYAAMTGVHLTAKLLPATIISGQHANELLYHGTLLFLVTGWLWAVGDTRCAATS